MSDLDELLKKAREVKAERSLEPYPKPPQFWPWAVVAVLLIGLSLGIHFFWPAH
ncbi:hypothetical protein [Swingsia samuiensis]|uniref:hypothetical protein n=1 Tax=Swingsia samuiensis TaxID=1293412 RepID=UPI0015E8A662|nr:hypothetical protein [Swingsia samuiensis]